MLREVLEESSKASEDYRLLVDPSPEDPVRIRGFLIYGPTPMTENTFDLYWIVVDSREQRKGIGKALLRNMERAILQNCTSARVRVETAGKETYAYQRQFYLSQGFREAGRIPDFYEIGDDLIIFWKELASQA